MTDLWSWIDQLSNKAWVEGDDISYEMVRCLYRSFNANQHSAEEALQHIRHGRELATRVDNRWFIQLMNHWELQIRFRYIGDFTDTLALAIKSTVAVRHPEFIDFPQRICLYEDLIVAYTETDPVGYQEDIQKALDYMEDAVTPYSECHLCLNNLKRDFKRIDGSAEDVKQMALADLQDAQKSPYHLNYIYYDLAEVAYQQKDWDNLLTWATTALEVVSRAPRFEPTAIIWLALYAQEIGDMDKRNTLLAQAMNKVERYGSFLGRTYYTALTAYHEHGQRWQSALEVQVSYFDRIKDTAQSFQECHALLNIIRLKRQLNLDVSDEIDTLKQTASQLKSPDYFLDKL